MDATAGGNSQADRVPVTDAGYPGAGAAWWTVSTLCLLYVISMLDRQIINLLVDDIKGTLQITDFQMSLVQGFSFALLYSTLGIPFGWASDRWSRRGIIFGGLVVWSMAAAACGLARNFWHLLFARIGVGAGEAALMPASYSLIGDSFPPHRRALAMSVFTVGAGIGAAASLFIGGVLIHEVPKEGLTLPFVGHLVGWQVVFLVTGIPGVLISWVVFTLRDPGRRNRTSDNTSPREAIQYLRKHKRLFTCHFLGFSLLAMPSWGMAAWIPAHFYRNFGWTPVEVGSALALINITVCTTGAAALGYIADRWYQSGRTDAHIRMFLFVVVIQLLSAVLGIGMGNAAGVLTGVTVMLSCSAVNGVAVSAISLITPNQFRGQITSIYLLIYSVICLGIGPSIVAAITDFVFADSKMVGWSIATAFIVLFPFSTTLLYLALKPFREKLAADGAQ